MKINLNESASAEVSRRGEGDSLGVRGVYKFEHIRDGEVLASWVVPNTITDEGKANLLNTYFNGGAQNTAWYIGLVDNAGFTATAAGDTYDQIGGSNGWTEFTGYTDPGNAGSATTRPEWPADNAVGTSITNGTVASFDITAAGVINGLFLVGGGASQTKGDATAGAILWSAASFAGGNRTVAVNDTLKVTYTVTA